MTYDQGLADALKEIDRLRAENQRLTDEYRTADGGWRVLEGDYTAQAFRQQQAEIARLKADYRRASGANDINWKAYKAMKQQRDEALKLLWECPSLNDPNSLWSAKVRAALKGAPHE